MTSEEQGQGQEQGAEQEPPVRPVITHYAGLHCQNGLASYAWNCSGWPGGLLVFCYPLGPST